MALGKRWNLPELEDQEDGREGADSRNGPAALHSGIVPPALDELVILAADLLIEDPKQREAVLPNRARNCTQGQPLEFSLPPHGQLTFARGGLQVAPAQQGQQPILDLRPHPDETHPVAHQLPCLP